MICIIRIRGTVGVPKDIEETMYRLRLRKKFVCVIVKETPEVIGAIKKIRNYVAYGKIDDSTLKTLIGKRGRKIGNKPVKITDVNKILEEIKSGKIETIKPFFSLHPARGGFKSIKDYYPKGALGDHKENIIKLVEKML